MTVVAGRKDSIFFWHMLGSRCPAEVRKTVDTEDGNL